MMMTKANIAHEIAFSLFLDTCTHFRRDLFLYRRLEATYIYICVMCQSFSRLNEIPLSSLTTHSEHDDDQKIIFMRIVWWWWL